VRLLHLLKALAYRRGSVQLSSGKASDYYINAKTVTLHPEGLWLVATLFLNLLERRPVAAVGGPTLGADPIVGAMAALSARSRRPLAALIVRKEAKAHGAGRQVEGPPLPRGARVVAVEDVTTTGGSLEQAVQALRACGYRVEEALTIVDRQEGGRRRLAAIGCRLRSLFTTQDFQRC
jgi:orotate phosphoribosyltransferase